MSRPSTALLRTASRALGFPPGTGELISPEIRPKLIFSLLGSVLLSALDMIGVLSMVPLMQYIAGQDPDTSALGLVNRAFGEPSDQMLLGILAGIIVGAFLLKDVTAVFFRRWQLRFMAEQEVQTSTQVLHDYLVGPYHWHLVKNTADKVWIAEYAVQIGYATGIASALGVLTEVLTITFVTVSLLLVSPMVTLAALVYFGVASFVMQRYLRGRVTAAGKASLEAAKQTSNSALQSLGAAKEIKLRHAHGLFVDEYHRARMTGAQARARQLLLSELPKYFLEIIFVLGIGLLAFLTSMSSNSSSALVLLGVFVAASSRIVPSIVRLFASLNGVRFAREPLNALLQERRGQRSAQVEDDVEVRTDEVPAGDIVLDHVSFAYPSQPDTTVIDDLDLRIPAGRSIAVVGGSGAGKSTLVDLILGLHKPTAGTVRVGGIDIRHNLPAWQRQLAVVPQDVYLLDESLRFNIVFNETADEARLADAVRRAQLTDLVAGMPEGLDTFVGERGTRLSGGQRQRIAMARALYRDPSVLVLDEATSALDNETERRLTQTITGLHGSMTMIIVAHRLSTVRHCDQLIFMKDGRIATIGTFDEVVAANEDFAHLVRLGSLDAEARPAPSSQQAADQTS